MARLFIFSALIFIGLRLPAQVNKYGVPLIDNYGTDVIHGSDYTHSIIKDKIGAIYFANEDMGIIRYDGINWRTIPVRNNQLIRALGIDSIGTIYVGGKYEFGYLEPDVYGKMNYVSLSERLEGGDLAKSDNDNVSDSVDQIKIHVGEILSLVVKGANVYFVSDEALFDYDIIKDTIRYINLRTLNLQNVLKVFRVNDKVILGDNTSGLYEYTDGKIKMLPGGEFFNRMRCMVMMPYDNSQSIVATFEHGLFLYNYVTGKVNKYFVAQSLQNLFMEYRIYSGTSVPSGEFALGTIQDGVYIIDRNGKLTKHWDKNNSGLKDNGGVLAFYSDTSSFSELWVSTVSYISKVYINLPFTEFSPKSGINGGVDCVCEMDDNIYVSTDLGVYRSALDDQGVRVFEKIPEIIDQVFPIYKAKVEDEEFLLAGSINGIFQIKRSGKVIKISGGVLDASEKDKKLDINVRIIVQSAVHPGRFYIGTNSEGVIVLDYDLHKWKTKRKFNTGQGSVVGIVEMDNGDLLFATDFSNNLYRVKDGDIDADPELYSAEKGIPQSTIYSIGNVKGEIILTTGTGLYKYVRETDSWITYDEITEGFSAGKESHNIMQDSDNDLWYSFKDKRYSEVLFKDSRSYLGSLALLPNVKTIDIKSLEKKIWLAKSNSVYIVEKDNLLLEQQQVNTILTKIIVGRDSVMMEESFTEKSLWGRKIPVKEWSGDKIPELKYNLNWVSFYWSSPYFIDEEQTLYSYKLEGFDDSWSGWEKVFYKDYTNLPFGHYYFRVKSKTSTGLESGEAVYLFIILKPWYLTTLMLVAYAIVLVVIILLIIKAYTRKLKKENLILEGLVAERTAVVVKQKDELESSIHYASRIQMALLPSETILSENVKDYLILFKPRDIVSGDFYWMTKKGERLYIVSADCTGHGVPGAFMSLLGMSFLDEIIDKNRAPKADFILSELRLHVTESLKQVGGDDEAKDGMDVALLIIDYNSGKIEFAGAYNPCFKVRKLTQAELKNYKEGALELPDGSVANGKYILETIYANKMPIGISSRMNEEFTIYEWEIKAGVSYYLFSDGYIDQFGGPKGRKFMKKNFKRLILDIQDNPMKKQRELLDKNLNEWMNGSPQIDDILVMGIKT